MPVADNYLSVCVIFDTFLNIQNNLVLETVRISHANPAENKLLKPA